MDRDVSTCDTHQCVKAIHLEPGVELLHNDHLPLMRRSLNLQEHNMTPTVTKLLRCLLRQITLESTFSAFCWSPCLAVKIVANPPSVSFRTNVNWSVPNATLCPPISLGTGPDTLAVLFIGEP